MRNNKKRKVCLILVLSFKVGADLVQVPCYKFDSAESTDPKKTC